MQYFLAGVYPGPLPENCHFEDFCDCVTFGIAWYNA